MANVVKSSVARRSIKSSSSQKVVKSSVARRSIKSSSSQKVVNAKVNFSMDTTRFKFNQTPVETPNGVITVFTLPNSESYVSNLVEVFLDGLQQIRTTDFSESASTTITMVTAPAAGEVLRLNYIKQ